MPTSLILNNLFLATLWGRRPYVKLFYPYLLKKSTYTILTTIL